MPEPGVTAAVSLLVSYLTQTLFFIRFRSPAPTWLNFRSPECDCLARRTAAAPHARAHGRRPKNEMPGEPGKPARRASNRGQTAAYQITRRSLGTSIIQCQLIFARP